MLFFSDCEFRMGVVYEKTYQKILLAVRELCRLCLLLRPCTDLRASTALGRNGPSRILSFWFDVLEVCMMQLSSISFTSPLVSLLSRHHGLARFRTVSVT